MYPLFKFIDYHLMYFVYSKQRDINFESTHVYSVNILDLIF